VIDGVTLSVVVAAGDNVVVGVFPLLQVGVAEGGDVGVVEWPDVLV
jgi:hypothetical protein